MSDEQNDGLSGLKHYMKNGLENPAWSFDVMVGRLIGMVVSAILVYYFLGFFSDIDTPLWNFVAAYVAAQIAVMLSIVMLVFFGLIVGFIFLNKRK